MGSLEKKFVKSVLKNTSEIVVILDLEGRILYATPSVEREIGYSADELTGKCLFDLLEEEEARKLRAFFFYNLSRKGVTETLDVNVHSKQGGRLCMEVRGNTLLGNTGIDAFLLSGRDVSEKRELEKLRIKAEDALRLSAKILQTMEGLILVTDDKGMVTYCNDAAERISGYKKEELLGSGWWKKTFDKKNQKEGLATQEYLVNFAKGGIRGEMTHERKLICKDGSTLWILWHNARGPNHTVIGVGNDISHLKKLEKELRKEIAFSENILAAMPDGMDMVDEEGNILYMNNKFKKIFGEDAIGKKCHEVYKDNKKRCHDCPLNKPIEIGKTETRRVEQIGGGRIFDITHTGIQLEKGQKGLLEIFRDVTLQTGQEKKLRQSEDILLEVGTLVILSDDQGEVIYCAPSVKKILGFQPHELYGNQWWEKTFADKEEGAMRKKKVSELRSRDVQIENYLRQVKCADGSLKWVLWNDSVSRDGNIISVGHDVTDMKDIEEKLQERTQELQEFFYRISHDMKGPGASIEGLVNVLQMDNNDPAITKYLGMMQESLVKLNKIIIEMNRVAGLYKGEIKPEEVDVHQIVKEVIKEVKQRHKPLEMRYVKKVKADKSLIADGKLLRIIIFNLVHNAVHFRQNKTDIRPEVRVSITQTKKHLKLRVADNGMGIPPVIQPKIYNMFYRGNEGSKGTGLGLFLVKKSVELLNGSISLKSEPDEGTEFNIQLPLPMQHKGE